MQSLHVSDKYVSVLKIVFQTDAVFCFIGLQRTFFLKPYVLVLHYGNIAHGNSCTVAPKQLRKKSNIPNSISNSDMFGHSNFITLAPGSVGVVLTRATLIFSGEINSRVYSCRLNKLSMETLPKIVKQ